MLSVLPSITDTELEPLLTTYTLFVVGLTDIAVGYKPTLISVTLPHRGK